MMERRRPLPQPKMNLARNAKLVKLLSLVMYETNQKAKLPTTMRKKPN